MKHWLTTQWPLLRSDSPGATHNGVWVADEKKDVIAPMRVGDLVWIYESKQGRTIVKEQADGGSHHVRHRTGRGGVVSLVEVTKEAEDDPARGPEHYADGTTIWWRWKAETRSVNSAGFLPRERLNEILGYKPGNVLRGFGSRNSGLMQIPEATHEEILEAFVASHAPADRDRLERKAGTARGGAGGEGPVHRRLKMAIAEDPAGLLGEAGLTTVEVEYAFGATGDRIDVLLKDRNGSYVAVEVEPECPLGHVAGPLQCMKYRSLLAYQLDRTVEEIRTWLVAHAIAPEVEQKAERYGIKCMEIPATVV